MQDGVLCYNRGMKTNDIVYGVHAVTEALLANTGNKLYLQDDLRGKNVEKVKELATEKKVSISWTSKKSLSEMTEGAVHQGFVLRVSEFAYSELDHILAKTRQEENPLLLILDGLTDPHNLGSILRTADATNVSGVIIPKHRAVGVTPVVAKTATGAIEHVPIARVTNLSQTLDKLKDEGFWKKNQYFTVYTESTAYRYQIFSYEDAVVGGNVYKVGYQPGEEYQTFIDEMVKNSDFDTGIRPKSRNKILTLSTCTDHDSSKRFAVHAVCIDTQKTSEE